MFSPTLRFFFVVNAFRNFEEIKHFSTDYVLVLWFKMKRCMIKLLVCNDERSMWFVLRWCFRGPRFDHSLQAIAWLKNVLCLSFHFPLWFNRFVTLDQPDLMDLRVALAGWCRPAQSDLLFPWIFFSLEQNLVYCLVRGCRLFLAQTFFGLTKIYRF